MTCELASPLSLAMSHPTESEESPGLEKSTNGQEMCSPISSPHSQRDQLATTSSGSNATPKLDLTHFAADNSVLQGLRLQMQQAVYQQFSGSLSFEVEPGHSYELIFRLGRIVWASGGQHRFRRWHRLVGEHCPTIARKVLKLQALQPSHIWEYQVLIRLLAQKRIERPQAAALIEANIVEVLVDLLRHFNNVAHPHQQTGGEYMIEQPIIIPSISELLSKAKQQVDLWNEAQLGNYSPDSAPVLQNSDALAAKVSAKTYRVLVHLLKGQASLRELTRILPQDLVQLSQMLSVYEQQNIIRFVLIPDFPAPWPKPLQRTSAKPAVQLPLICCVDDNPLVGRSLGQIVQKQGYRYRYVQDSVKALQEIIEHKPALIFVDLVMPVISGYELCSQIRRIAQFKDIPLIIVTGNDGVVDRVRSKIAGSTEFITKPVDEAKVAATLKRYVGKEKPKLMVSKAA